MNRFYILLFRASLAALFAIILSRIFFQESTILKTVGLAIGLLGFSYLFEYVRNKDQERGPK